MATRCPFRDICEIPAGEGRVTTYGAAGRLCGYEQAGTVEECRKKREMDAYRNQAKTNN